MKIITVYKSKTGFTKKYAQWIAENLGCDFIDSKNISVESLNPYDIVIYGGGITAGQIGGLKKFKTLMKSFQNKKLIVFATGATPAELKEACEDIIKANFNEQEKRSIPCFYFRSGINYENMNAGSKMLMKMFTSMLSKNANKTPEEQGMADTIKQSCDYSKKEYIEPLVNYVHLLQEENN